MARSRPFNLTAQLNIQGPNNLRPVIANIRRQLGTLNTNLTLNIDRNASRNIQNLNNQVNTLNNTLRQTATISQQVSANLNTISAAANNVQQNTTRANAALGNTQNTVRNLNTNIQQARDSMEDFGRQSALAVRRFVAFSTAAAPIYALTRAISGAFEEFVKFDKEVVRLVQVTGKSRATLSGLTEEITRLSTTLGVSSSELISVSSTLAQAGLSASQTTIALEALAKASLAPSFDDLSNTVEGSIAAMRQFGIASSQLEGALGSINAVAAAFAVEAGDIIAAIQRTGGVFAAASNGVSQGTDALNEFIAVFTSVRATTRESAETIATGLRTIFTRIQRGSTIEFLRELGIQLTDVEGKFVGPFKAVERLSAALRTLDPRDLRYSQIVEELGGFRQIGKVIPLIQQFATAQQALKVAQEGQGSLTRDAVTAQQSLANQFIKVREEFLAFVRSIGESKTFQNITKLVLGLASSLISVGQAFKPILPYLAILGAIRGTQAAVSFGRGFFGGGGGGGGGAGGPAAPTGGPAAPAPTAGATIQQQNVLNNATVVSNTNAITAQTTALGSNTTALASLQASLNQMNNTFVNGVNVLARAITQISNNNTQTLFGGGKVLGFNRGGTVPGSGKGDKVPALLEPGEVVMSNRAVSKYGRGNLVRMNKYADGGTTIQDLKGPGKRGFGKKTINSYQNSNTNIEDDDYINTSGSIIRRETLDKILKLRDFEKSIPDTSSKDTLERKQKSYDAKIGSIAERLLETKLGAKKYSGLGTRLSNESNAPIDLESEDGSNIYEVKFKNESTTDAEIYSKLLRYKLEKDPTSILNQFKENQPDPKDEISLGSITLIEAGNLRSELDAAYRPKKAGGKIQNFMGGSAGGVKAKPEPFGTGVTKFPRRISNAYAKQMEKEETALRFDRLIQKSPINERIMVDEAMEQQISQGMKQPLDREQFAASFRRAVLRDEIASNISNFAKLVGLPQEDLSVVLPRQLDFGAGTGPIGSRGGRGGLGGAFTTISPYGSRGAEGWDLSEFGYTKQDEQDLFGFEKLLEEKKKEREKIRKTPTRTFDDGSTSFDLQAYDKASDEYNALNKQIYDIRTKRDAAISAANKAKEKEVASSGRATLGFGTIFGKAQNPVFYHELTHQLFKGLRAKSADSFDKYKQRVTTLFETDNDGLADAFDALGAGYSSADVVYGRSYKLDLLGARQREEVRKDPAGEDVKNLSSLIKSGSAAKKATEFRPINPDFNSAMLKFYSQEHLDKVEDNGKEEFLTTLVEKMPVLDQRLQGILDSTMTELLGGAGIQRQKYADGGDIRTGVTQRKLGYIDYDVIANPVNEAVVTKGMEDTGVSGPRLYTDKLIEMAVKARKEQSLNKLRAIYGVAGAGKTTLARGQGTDKATLRETERFPILSPEDIQKATEVLLLSSSVSKDKLDTLFADVDRSYTLSSTMPEEKEIIKAQRESRDITGVGAEGRAPGSTTGVTKDTAVGEALLADRLGERSVVLGRTGSGRLRRKRGDELVEIVKKRIGMTWGGFAPMTAGHESILDAAAAMGISPEDFVFLVGSNESIKLGDPSSYRTAVFNQDARVLLAKAGAGARGATVVPKAADFEVPLGVDISEPTGRRKVLLPGEGSTVFVGDKTEQQTAKYKTAGYNVSNIGRTGGISGTMVRDLIMAGNMGELQKVLSPGVYELISNNIGRIQNRANVLPDIIEQVKQSQGVKLVEVERAIQEVSISRIDPKKMEDPEYAAKAQVLEELRAQRDKIKKSSAFEPYRLLDKLAASQPEQYALDFSQSQTVIPAPVRTVKDRALAAVAAETSSVASVSSGDTGVSTGQSLLDNLASRLKTLGGESGLKGLGVSIPLDLQRRVRTNLIKEGVLDTARITGLIEQGEKRKRQKKDDIEGTRHVAMAGLQPLDYSWDPEWELDDGRKYIATIRGFKSSYLQDIERFRARQKEAALEFGRDTTATEALGLLGQKTVQGPPRSLAIDFDDTLAFGTKMLDSSGKEDISAYYDEARVREVLSRATPTRLAQRLAEIEKDQPGTVRAYTRVLTARAESLKHLVTETLNRFGLPYTDSDITGVGQRGDNDRAIARKKGDNLSAIERFIDDNEKNISVAQEKGIQSYRYSEPKAFENASDYEPFGAGNIEGALLEQTLAMKIGRPIDFEALEQNRALDFPNGLGAAASLFGLPPNIETEVKRTLNKDSFAKARKEFNRYFKENPSKYNIGGLVSRFAKGGSVPALVSNGEAYVPPRLAKSIGYGKLNRMNQADRNGMSRFSEGGISVFRGPGTGTSDSIPTNLPVGSFILRAKATKALGFNRGGSVGSIQRFQNGGGAESRYSAGFIGSGGLDADQSFIPLNMLANQANSLAQAQQQVINTTNQSDDATQQLAAHTMKTNRIFAVLNTISPNLAGKFREMSDAMGGATATIALAATTLSTQLPVLYDTLDRFAGTQLLSSGIGAGVAGGIQQAGASTFAGINAAKQAGFGTTGTIATSAIAGIGGAISGYLQAKEQKDTENLRKALQESDARMETLFGRLEQTLAPEKRAELEQQLYAEIGRADKQLGSALDNSSATMETTIGRLAEAASGLVITFAALKTAVRRSDGGIVYASKGTYVKYQPKGTDTVPAMLSPGEFVVNAKSTRKNLGLLNAINKNNGGFIKPNYLARGGMPSFWDDYTRNLSNFYNPFSTADSEADNDFTGKALKYAGRTAMGIGAAAGTAAAGLGAAGIGAAGTVGSGLGMAARGVGSLGGMAARGIRGATSGRGMGRLVDIGLLAGGIGSAIPGISGAIGGAPTDAQIERNTRRAEVLDSKVRAGSDIETRKMDTEDILSTLNRVGGMQEGAARDEFLTQTGTSPVVQAAEKSALTGEGINTEVLVRARKKAEADQTTEEKKAIETANRARESLFEDAFLKTSQLDEKEKALKLNQAKKALDKQKQGKDISEQEQKAIDGVYGVGKKYIAQQSEQILQTEKNNRLLKESQAAAENFVNAINTIEAGLQRATATFGEGMLQIDNSLGVMEGRIPKVSRLTEDIFGNLRAYKPEEIAKASSDLAKSFGFDKISSGTRVTEAGVENVTLADTLKEASLATRALEVDLPRIFRENAGAVGGGDIRKQIQEGLMTGGVSEETAKSIAKEIADKASSQTAGGKAVSFAELARDVPGFLNSVESLKKANELQAKLIKTINDSLDTYNTKIQEAAERTVEASRIRADSAKVQADFQVSVKQALGKRTTLAEETAGFDAGLRELTTIRGAGGAPVMQGTTDPVALQRRSEAAQQELNRLAQEQQAAGAGGFGDKNRDAAMKMQTEIIKKSNEALKRLAEDGSRAASALSKVQELSQARQARRGGIMKLLSNMDNPEFMMEQGRIMGATQRVKGGNASLQDIQLVAQNFDEITSMMDPAMAQRFTEQFKDLVKNIPGLTDETKKFIEGAFNPQSDPAVQQAIRVAEAFKNQQIEAQKILAANLEEASQKIMEGLPAAAEEFRKIITQAAVEAANELSRQSRERLFQGAGNVPVGLAQQLITPANVPTLLKNDTANISGLGFKSAIKGDKPAFDLSTKPQVLKDLIASGSLSGTLEDGTSFADAIGPRFDDVITALQSRDFNLDIVKLEEAIQNNKVKFDQEQLELLTEIGAIQISIQGLEKLDDAKIELDLDDTIQKQLDDLLDGFRKFKAEKPATLARGGVVYANKGRIIGMQPKGTDTVPAMLTPGEFVINKAATARNLPLLKAINSGKTKGYSKGGVLYAEKGAIATPPAKVSAISPENLAEYNIAFDELGKLFTPDAPIGSMVGAYRGAYVTQIPQNLEKYRQLITKLQQLSANTTATMEDDNLLSSFYRSAEELIPSDTDKFKNSFRVTDTDGMYRIENNKRIIQSLLKSNLQGIKSLVTETQTKINTLSAQAQIEPSVFIDGVTQGSVVPTGLGNTPGQQSSTTLLPQQAGANTTGTKEGVARNIENQPWNQYAYKISTGDANIPEIWDKVENSQDFTDVPAGIPLTPLSQINPGVQDSGQKETRQGDSIIAWSKLAPEKPEGPEPTYNQLSPDYYDELTYKEWLKKIMGMGSAPQSPIRDRFKTRALYIKEPGVEGEKDRTTRVTGFDTREKGEKQRDERVQASSLAQEIELNLTKLSSTQEAVKQLQPEDPGIQTLNQELSTAFIDAIANMMDFNSRGYSAFVNQDGMLRSEDDSSQGFSISNMFSRIADIAKNIGSPSDSPEFTEAKNIALDPEQLISAGNIAIETVGAGANIRKKGGLKPANLGNTPIEEDETSPYRGKVIGAKGIESQFKSAYNYYQRQLGEYNVKKQRQQRSLANQRRRPGLYMSNGGDVPGYYAAGGNIFKPRGTDTVPAMLTPGEFVVNRKATQANLGLLHQINKNSGTRYYQKGGQVSYLRDGGMANGSMGIDFSPFMDGVTQFSTYVNDFTTAVNNIPTWDFSEFTRGITTFSNAIAVLTGSLGPINTAAAAFGTATQNISQAVAALANIPTTITINGRIDMPTQIVVTVEGNTGGADTTALTKEIINKVALGLSQGNPQINVSSLLNQT